jgi:DHA2 family multidrug resistance protein
LADDRPNPNWKPKYNPWLVAIVVAIASFMEVLDTSIANVALPHISGNLGASQDQATWVLTTYWWPTPLSSPSPDGFRARWAVSAFL